MTHEDDVKIEAGYAVLRNRLSCLASVNYTDLIGGET